MKMFSCLKKRIITLFKLFLGMSIISTLSCTKHPRPESRQRLLELTDAKKVLSEPTQKEVILKAKDFLRIYLVDYKNFIKQSDDLMADEMEAEFHNIRNRWYVFFSTGSHHLHVDLDKSATIGTVYSTNGSHITRAPYTNNRAHTRPDFPEALFSLSEFEKVMNLPHNKASLGRQ